MEVLNKSIAKQKEQIDLLKNLTMVHSLTEKQALALKNMRLIFLEQMHN
ncbi:hypothetical protein ACGO3R_13710 [Lactococcus lactis]